MTNAQSFPICRLPSVACDCVIQNMDLREKYILSTLSRRAGRATKVASLREKYTLHIRIEEDDASVCLKSHPSKNCITMGIYKIGGQSCSVENEVHALWTEDIQSALVGQIRSIPAVFKCKGVSLELDNLRFEPLDILPHLVSEIRKMNLRIFKFVIYDYDANNELFDFVWKNIRHVDTLVCRASPDGDYEWKIKRPFNFRRCDFTAPSKFNVNHLIKCFMNCRILNVFDLESKNVPAALRKFLKKWMEGSKLEYVRFQLTNDLNFARTFNGITYETILNNRLVKIRQKNGVEARIYLEDEINLVLTTYASPRAEADLWADDENIEDLEAMEIVDDVETDTDEEGSDDEEMDDEESDDEEEMDNDEEDMDSDEDEVDESGNEDSDAEGGDSEEDGNDDVIADEELDEDDA